MKECNSTFYFNVVIPNLPSTVLNVQAALFHDIL